MRFTKRQLLSLFVVFLIATMLSTYKLPYYIYKPGKADALDSIVDVMDGYQSEGDMHLVTVSGGQATPVQLLTAKLKRYHEILPIEVARPEGMTDEEYMHAQLQMMESSQEASTVVAFEAANEQITIEYNGVYVVAVIEGMPADGKLEMGDRIISVDDIRVNEADDLVDYVQQKKAGSTVELKIDRNEKTITETLLLEKFTGIDNKIGIGIQLVTNRDVYTEPEVQFASGNIGGPSAGLMFALEIYDQLTEEDLTKGLQIIGTGEVDYNGNVISIGGVDKKVIAADRAGCDIFFVPNEGGSPNSNYHQAKAVAEEIDTDMILVPVDTFDEALAYLQNLDIEAK